MKSKSSVKTIEIKCAEALARVGITMRQGIGILPINKDFLGWIGLNAGKYDDFIRINPFVGVHCPSVMQLTAAATGQRYRANDIATYAVFIGNLCPNIAEFIFRNDLDLTAESDRLATMVEEFALPFMSRIANYETVLPLLKSRVPNLGGYPQRYAASLYLSGKEDAAVEFIDNEIIKLKLQMEVEVVNAMSELRKLLLSSKIKC